MEEPLFFAETALTRRRCLGSGGAPGREGAHTAFCFCRWLDRFRRGGIYQFSVPWQEFAQVRVVAFQPMVLATFLTPLLWVAAFTVVLL